MAVGILEVHRSGSDGRGIATHSHIVNKEPIEQIGIRISQIRQIHVLVDGRSLRSNLLQAFSHISLVRNYRYARRLIDLHRFFWSSNDSTTGGINP